MKNENATPVVVGIVIMFCTIVIASAALVIARPDAPATGTIITAILGSFATLSVGLLTLAKVRGTDDKVTQLTNGLMDAKSRAAIAEVLPDHLVSDVYKTTQMSADLEKRDTHAHH